MEYTIIVRKSEGWLLGQLKELPEVITQAVDLEELRENIADALKMRLEIWREKYKLDGDYVDMEMEEQLIEI